MQRTPFRLEFVGHMDTKTPLRSQEVEDALEKLAKGVLDNLASWDFAGVPVEEANADIDIITDPPSFFRVLDISTRHIAQSDGVWLSEASYPNHPSQMIVREYEEGWWVHITKDDKDWLPALKKFGYPEAVIAVLQFALDHGCDYAFIDRDGKEYPQLPKYDW